MARSAALRNGRAGDDAGKLVLRLTVGVLILFHGVAKFAGGVGFIAGALGKAGMPPEIAYAVYIGEVVAPALLILGLWTRPAALVVVINMVVAVLLAHRGQLTSIADTGGYALELQAMFLFGALAVVLLGAGRYSLGGAYGRWN